MRKAVWTWSLLDFRTRSHSLLKTWKSSRSSLLFDPARHSIYALASFGMAMGPNLTSVLRSGSMAMVGCGGVGAESDGIAESGVARRLFKLSKEPLLAKYTAFVIGLASGGLKIDTYRHYISQDFYFLKAFAHAYELAYECADDDDAKVGMKELRNNVLDELKLHNSLAKDWGVDLSKEDGANAATLKYTNFLLATASGKVDGVKGPGKLATPFERTKVAAYTLAAMTPCMQLYAYIGKELRRFMDSLDANHPYKRWIDTYSSEGFQASALQSEDLLDKLSASLTGEELDVIKNLYNQAMKLEIEFFNAQPLDHLSIVPLMKEHNPIEEKIIIFSDFDLTCSVVDSSAILAEIAIVTASKNHVGGQSNDQNGLMMDASDLRNSWSLLSSRYTEEYEQCIETILRTNEVAEFNYEALCKALEPLTIFERQANTRVVDSGVLKGLNYDDIRKAGERLHLQDGCVSFFQTVLINAKIHVLSACWCADLIRSSFASTGLDAIQVHANEMTFEQSISTGNLVKKVESSSDKVEAFQTLLKDDTGKGTLTVFIGDSVVDLLCLLQADIGIVIGSSSSLRRVGQQFGVSFVPLFDGLVRKQKAIGEGCAPQWSRPSGVLYTVSCWAEIHAFVLGW